MIVFAEVPVGHRSLSHWRWPSTSQFRTASAMAFGECCYANAREVALFDPKADDSFEEKQKHLIVLVPIIIEITKN